MSSSESNQVEQSAASISRVERKQLIMRESGESIKALLAATLFVCLAYPSVHMLLPGVEQSMGTLATVILCFSIGLIPGKLYFEGRIQAKQSPANQ